MTPHLSGAVVVPLPPLEDHLAHVLQLYRRGWGGPPSLRLEKTARIHLGMETCPPVVRRLAVPPSRLLGAGGDCGVPSGEGLWSRFS